MPQAVRYKLVEKTQGPWFGAIWREEEMTVAEAEARNSKIECAKLERCEPEMVSCPVCDGTCESKVSGRKCTRCTDGMITKDLSDRLQRIRADLYQRMAQQ